jgi:hypothetical protein
VILTELEEELGVTEGSLGFRSGVVLIRGSLRIRVRVSGWNIVLVQLLCGLHNGKGGIKTPGQVFEQTQHGMSPGLGTQELVERFQSLLGCLLGRKANPFVMRAVQ